MSKQVQVTERDAEKERLKALAAVAGKSTAFTQARQVFRPVRAVPTIFAGVDIAMRVGGWPIERVALVHGESAHGKSVLCDGVGLSFLKRGHFYKKIDAERTGAIDWMEKLFGTYLDHPGFSAMFPPTYESAVKEVREWATTIGNARETGKLPKDVTGLAVVDSVRKLVPKGFFDRVGKVVADGEAKKKGARTNAKTAELDYRGAQLRAHLHAMWLDELTGLLHDTGTAMILVTREHEDTNADFRAVAAGRNYVVGGGRALRFESSMTVRVERAFVWGPGKDGEKRPIYGENHRVAISKSKVAGLQDREEVGWFATSNGVLVPAGFDRARDLVHLGKQFDVLSGDAWITWKSKKIRWQGENRAVVDLTPKTVLLDELEAEIRAAWKETAG
jgi:RecA/RadA recombinase